MKVADRSLEYVKEFEQWKLCHLSKERVFEYFFFGENKILYVADNGNRLSGVMTLGNFMENPDNIEKAVREKYLFIREDGKERMFSEAQELYDQYGIESDLPVLDCEGRMTGYITDREILQGRKAVYEQKITETENKIRDFKRSRYLEKEVRAFYEVLSHTKIYFRPCGACRRIFSLFDGKIKGTCLSDSEYENKLKRMLSDRDRLTEEERTEVVFDFEFGNRKDLFGCGLVPVYSLEKFAEEYTALTEQEEFSRIVKMTHDARYSLADFITDNGMEELQFPANRLLTKYFHDYMKKCQIPLLLTYFDSISVLRAGFSVNGLRGSSQDVIGLSSCDLTEQLLLSKMLSERKIHVFNIQNASNARMTEGEKNRLKRWGVLETLIDNKDEGELQRLYGEECGNRTPYEYAKEILCYFPIKRRLENDLIVNADYSSPYVNVENGIRRTCCQPERYTNTIYFFGPCIALGPYVEDKHTIASLLARRLMEGRYAYRVVNLGILGSNSSLELMKQIDFQENDIVINMFYTEGEKLRDLLEDVIDPSDAFNEICNRKDMFFDKSVHCNRKGNEIYAEVIYQAIQPVLTREHGCTLKKNHIYDVFRTNDTDLHLYGFPEYLGMLEREKAKIPREAKTIGSIVMNCNPFTLGHQYLVEYALGHCDYLFVFVVQEDKSYFSFEDRFAIAADNCRQYRNVSVLPSGKMIASDITFPEYFQRERTRDRTESMANMRITPVQDFRLFAGYIAPVLGLRKRFVAEEPLDPVTRQYNDNMKKVLGAFDIKVVEIKRKTLSNGEIISASKVRDMYRRGEYDKMKEMLPECTYRCLLEKLSGGGRL